MAKSIVTVIAWVILSCTWSLRKYWWCEEPRDQLDSGPDHAGWPVSSPVYTRFQESPAGVTRIFYKCMPAFNILYLSCKAHTLTPSIPHLPTPPSILTPGKGIPVYQVPPGISLCSERPIRGCIRPQDQFEGDRKDFWVLVNLLQIQARQLVWPEGRKRGLFAGVPTWLKTRNSDWP